MDIYINELTKEEIDAALSKNPQEPCGKIKDEFLFKKQYASVIGGRL